MVHSQHKIKLHCQASLLELTFSDGYREMLSFEILRVNSPAITRHKSSGDLPLLVTDKIFVKLNSVEQIGNTGLHLTFDDGHEGLFDWPYLYQLAKNQDRLWADYLKRLTQAKILKQQPLALAVDYAEMDDISV